MVSATSFLCNPNSTRQEKERGSERVKRREKKTATDDVERKENESKQRTQNIAYIRLNNITIYVDMSCFLLSAINHNLYKQKSVEGKKTLGEHTHICGWASRESSVQ